MCVLPGHWDGGKEPLLQHHLGGTGGKAAHQILLLLMPNNLPGEHEIPRVSRRCREWQLL